MYLRRACYLLLLMEVGLPVFSYPVVYRADRSNPVQTEVVEKDQAYPFLDPASIVDVDYWNQVFGESQPEPVKESTVKPNIMDVRIPDCASATPTKDDYISGLGNLSRQVAVIPTYTANRTWFYLQLVDKSLREQIALETKSLNFTLKGLDQTVWNTTGKLDQQLHEMVKSSLTITDAILSHDNKMDLVKEELTALKKEFEVMKIEIMRNSAAQSQGFSRLALLCTTEAQARDTNGSIKAAFDLIYHDGSTFSDFIENHILSLLVNNPLVVIFMAVLAVGNAMFCARNCLFRLCCKNCSQIEPKHRGEEGEELSAQGPQSYTSTLVIQQGGEAAARPQSSETAI